MFLCVTQFPMHTKAVITTKLNSGYISFLLRRLVLETGYLDWLKDLKKDLAWTWS